MILESKKDFDGARDHMQRYLTLEPKAGGSGERARLASRIWEPPKPPTSRRNCSRWPRNCNWRPSSEAWVPGGMKALAAMAGVGLPALRYRHRISSPSTAGYWCARFRRDCARGCPSIIGCWKLTWRASPSWDIPASAGKIKRSITLSLAGDEQRKNTERILNLIGWRLTLEGEVEPGDQPADGFRQRIPALLGIDEIDMQKALEAGRTFRFEVPTENARLVGGDAWTQLIAGPSHPGGLAEAFVRDSRLAKVYAGLGAMGADTAAAVVRGVGLRPLVEKYADIVARDSETFALAKDGAAVPGDAEAWKKIAGVSPSAAPAFFRALLERDEGSLAAFHQTLSHADAAHQHFFTATPARAETFYTWYRDSGEPRWSMTVTSDRWRTALFQKLPLDAGENVRFPGGRRAWTQTEGSDDETLLKLPSLEALVPVARVEQERKRPLDEESARLLALYYPQWRALFPYFEKLPGLGSPEFQAMAAFTQSVSGYQRAQQSVVLGEWYSLVELIERGVRAGSLDLGGKRAGVPERMRGTGCIGSFHESGGRAAGDAERKSAGRRSRIGGQRSASSDSGPARGVRSRARIVECSRTRSAGRRPQNRSRVEWTRLRRDARSGWVAGE